jgi:hypothetical protein
LLLLRKRRSSGVGGCSCGVGVVGDLRRRAITLLCLLGVAGDGTGVRSGGVRGVRVGRRLLLEGVASGRVASLRRLGVRRRG